MRSVRHRPHLVVLLVFSILLAAPTSPARAADAEPDTTPGWGERFGRAMRNAALSPRTWVPLLGALALQAGDADRRLQAWAAEHTPIFGSRRQADSMSDDFKLAANSAWVASALAPWREQSEGSWLADKTQVLAVQVSAHMVTSTVVGELKDSTARMRPNGEGATSFPSDHASRVALHGTLAKSNLRQLGWSDRSVAAADLGLDALSMATAWARVEANQHYPSDVLAGLALGHFIGTFATEAFLGGNAAQAPQLNVQAARDRFVVALQLSF